MKPERRRILLEGLRAGDLGRRVRPLVEIDGYEPKFDPDNVVVAFRCDGERVAFDLARWIFLGPCEGIVDVDFSDVPDGMLTWHVYVEYPRDGDLPERIAALVDDLGAVVPHERWTFRVRPEDPPEILEPARLRSRLRLDGKRRYDAVRRLRESTGLPVDDDRRVTVAGIPYRVVAHGPTATLLDAVARAGFRPRLDEEAAIETMRLGATLDPGCGIEVLDRVTVVHYGNDAVVLEREI